MGNLCSISMRLHLNMYILLSVSGPKPCLDYMYAFEHGWARLLKQQSSIIVVYRLPTKENKLPFLFYVSVWSKQAVVFRFRFAFAVNERKWPFSVISFFCSRNSWNMETKRLRDMEMEAWKHGDIYTRHGNMEKWSHRDMYMETWTWNFKKSMEYGKRKPRLFFFIYLPFAHCANGNLLFVCLLAKK